MIFSVSNNGIEWSLDFRPDSVTLNAKGLLPEMTLKSQETSLAASSLLMSQRQNFLNNHLAGIPVTPNQDWTLKMKDEVLSSVGAQDMGTSGCYMSDHGEVQFNWENDQLDVNAWIHFFLP